MNTENHCLECNAPLTPAEAQGLCARCLLKMGLASQLGESSVAAAGARRIVPPPLFPFDFGGYRILRLLGRGGMGAVYEAEQRDNGRRVALKVLGHAIDSEEMRKRFLREGRLAASVNHPNSVYIFGSEEIDGAPVIAMEFVGGGTLRDRIRKGPLPVSEAVDAALQIIAGLEAAAAAGVLHRDVKPANCFVAPDGTVKVGDFGLSVSTLARGDTQLTESGMMLGTPSFAPPEQLRGDDLDVRADIYSVGATLHALLTGRAPFEGANAVQVVAAVLDSVPPPIVSVPAGLAQIVARCLAKRREDRPASYAALRDALLPFSSHVATPAPLGLRVAAGLIDCLLATLPGTMTLIATGLTMEQQFLSRRTLAATMECSGYLLAAVAYFAIPEWLWGASLGKALCGLRVAPHGLMRMMTRAAMLIFAMYLGMFIQLGINSAEEIRAIVARNDWTFSDAVGPAFVLLLFVTARRKNGFAAIHDLLTGTRVIARPRADVRSRLDVPPLEAPVGEGGGRIGPFRVLGPLAQDWLIGYDDALRRNVWIRKCGPGAPVLPPARRDLGRAGRLRWIAGTRGSDGGWDVFDAPSGRPLSELTAQPWAAVRRWLLDLAEEIDAATKDGTLPDEVSPGNVWIAADGTALLLDEPWPFGESRGGAVNRGFACSDNAASQRFLASVANAVLDHTQIPLHARDFLRRLSGAAFDRGTFLIGNLRSLLGKPAELSRRRRFASVALVPGIIVILGILVAMSIVVDQREEEARWVPFPELQMLHRALDFHNNLGGGLAGWASGTGDVAVEHFKMLSGKYIAGRFGAFVTGPEYESHPIVKNWSEHDRAALRELVRTHSPVAPDELAASTSILRPILDQQPVDARVSAYAIAPGIFVIGLAVIGVVQLVSLLVFRATPGQRVFGFAVVNKAGDPAGRMRLLWRWVVIWAPFAAIVWQLAIVFLSGEPWDSRNVRFLRLTCVLWLAAMLRCVTSPARGFHDRLAGTFVVPR